ncbi:hypothetical protein F6U93_11295 [Tamlana haliotis]|uniref:Uncharacterized protein n=2 Tax=Pseudomonadati TaxID=3379134 RepID=A0A6N6MCB8_9FLAO|nr:hypothetical protein [Tamlana haliotis]KAB1067332.1 hypothetical protein F6U93_11295 [Tamlana haliotis]
MTGYLETVQKSKNYNNYKLTADKVIQILSDVRNERTKSRRRWIWELMQNAKDVPNIYGGVTIEITLRENEFIFSHNGNPFRVENITGLIQQVSSGKPSDSTNKRITGKFGTGFISTHLLSDTVTVKGIVEQDGLLPKTFQFELNRKAEKSEDLITFIADELDKIEKIEDELLFPTKHNYHSQRKETDFDTVFIYPLENPESREAAVVGVDDLASTLPQTLFFVEELKKVIIHNEITGKQITYELFENNNEGDFYFPVIKETINEKTQDLCFIHYKDDKIDLAIPINNHTERSIKIIEKSARLYRDFPLVGTEHFYFPFILNGLSFFPTEKRDSVLLTDTTSNKVLVNRDIFIHAINKSQLFVEWLKTNNAINLSLIAQSRIPTALTELEVINWFKENIQKPYRHHLIEQEIVETTSGKIKIKDAVIPKYAGTKEQNEQFWEILNSYFGGDTICRKEHLGSWQDNLGIESEIETWGQKVFYTVEDLLNEIQSKTNLESIAIQGSQQTNIQWLNSVYKFLIDNELIKHFKEYKIIPTIKGTLKSLNDDLYIEKETKIPNEFISIFKNLKNEDWNDILIHRELIAIDNSHASKKVKDISDEINKILNSEEKNQFGQVQSTYIDRANAENILLDILSISASSSIDSFQSKLFNSAKVFFKSEKQPIVINGVSEFNFNPAKRQLIKLLHKKIEVAKNLSNLLVENSEKWLLNHLLLLQESTEFKTLLEFGNIIPNRKGEFCAFVNEVFAYGTNESPLDDDLIEILYELNNEEDWDKHLINDYFRSLKLPAKTIEALATKLKDELEKLRLENTFSTKSSAILKLIHWCSDYNNRFVSAKHFDWFLSQKDKIFVNISLEDSEVGGNIVKLLTNKEKLNDLVALAESGINLSQLSDIAEIAKSISIEEIKSLSQQLKDERDDFEFKKKIGEAVEKAFIEAFESLNLPYKITYQGIGSQDVVITNNTNNKSFYIELKSLSPTNWDKSLKLAVSQARKAVEQIQEENYVVSVLIRPSNWETATAEFIKENLNNQFNIGKLLTAVVQKDKAFEQLLNTSNEVDLAFEDTRRKVRVAENLWRSNGHSFSALIEKLNGYLK